VTIDQNGARRAQPGSAAELRATQTQHIAQNPQQRSVSKTIIDLDLDTIHVEFQRISPSPLACP
jgi:hypothetical protein